MVLVLIKRFFIYLNFLLKNVGNFLYFKNYSVCIKFKKWIKFKLVN